MLFDGRNYLLWQQRMYDALALQDLSHTTTPPLPGLPAASSLREDCKARSIINSTLSDAILRSMPDRAQEDVRALLSYLENTYMESSAMIAFMEFKKTVCKHIISEGQAVHLRSVQDYLVSKAGLRREASAYFMMFDVYYCRNVIVGLGTAYMTVVNALFEQMDTLPDHPDVEKLHEMVIDAFETFYSPDVTPPNGNPRIPKGNETLPGTAHNGGKD